MAHHALITGGAGFIGSHLADQLLARGQQVTLLDDLSTGDARNVAHLLNRKDVALVVDSVLNTEAVERLIRSVDCVFHLASSVGVKLIMNQPVRTIENIYGGAYNVLTCCAAHHKPVLLASTSEVYGKGVATPFQEDDDVLTGATSKHRWAYACAKALDEFLALAHWRQSQLQVAVVRLFNTVGPRQSGKYGMVLPRFVAAALRNEPLLVYGDGAQKRCFAHVADVVRGLAGAIETPGCMGEVMNLGNNQEISILHLARRVIEQTGSSSDIKLTPYDEVFGDGFEDMLRRTPCLKKAQRLTGYAPELGLNDMIRDIVEYQQSSP